MPINSPTPPGICFGPFELDAAAGELRKAGTLIKLQPQPFRVLQLLAERAGTVVTREEIQQHLWSESTFVDFEHGINFSINQIRGALADDAEKPRYIETLPRRGYRFIAAVRPASDGHKAAEIVAAIGAASPARELTPELPANGEKEHEARYESAAETRNPVETLNQDGVPRHSARWREMTAASVVILLIISGAFWFANRTSGPKTPPAGLKLRQLTINSFENRVTSGGISPDGKYLAYCDTKGMYIKLIETGETRAVAEPQEFKGKEMDWEVVGTWFPDSTRFVANAQPTAGGVFESGWSSQDSSVWAVSVLGEPPHKLRDDAIAYSVSPDGSLIGFGTNKGKFGEREIWMMGPSGGQARRLFDVDEESSIGGLRWSPDGTRVLYVKTDRSGDTLLTRDLKGGPPNSLLGPGEMKQVNDFFWLAEGRLLYSVAEPGSLEGSACNFWEMRLNAHTGTPIEKPRKLTNWSGFCMSDLGITADGKKLAFLKWAGKLTPVLADLAEGGTRILGPKHFPLSESSEGMAAWTPSYPIDPVILGFTSSPWTRTLRSLS